MFNSQLQQFFSTGRGAAKPKVGRDSRKNVIIFALAACIVAFLDLSDVVLAFAGALAFLMFNNVVGTKPKLTSDDSSKFAGSSDPGQESLDSAASRCAGAHPQRNERDASVLLHSQQKKSQGLSEFGQQQTWQPSVCPVMSPSFASADWEGQINEFLSEVMPTAETYACARSVACAVQDVLRATFPNVDVAGFAHGNPKSSKAFATAVPDVEIVAKMDSADMIHDLGAQYARYDTRCIQKAAIRACTDHLAYGDFKFRRSAFKYDEPKVTLLAPALFECIPFDFSVNNLTPMRHDVLLQECAKVDMRAWQLILLVHRWARDRGIAHAAKGHLTPYAWSLVVIFYLQVREKGDGVLMPPFQPAAPHFRECKKSKKQARDTAVAPRTPVSTLFKEFMNFYAVEFDWRLEALSIKKASRDARAPERNVVEWRRQALGLHICDPFEPSANLGSLLSSEGRERLLEELTRADGICSKGEPLSKLLEPWTPAEPADARGTATNDEVKCTRDIAAKASTNGSLTGSLTSMSLRPGGASLRPTVLGKKGKVSLTASPLGLQLGPSNASSCNGSETESTQSGTSSPASNSDVE